jgi:hypothetical protein
MPAAALQTPYIKCSALAAAAVIDYNHMACLFRERSGLDAAASESLRDVSGFALIVCNPERITTHSADACLSCTCPRNMSHDMLPTCSVGEAFC